MCTVIFIPKNNREFLLASSRDEHQDRPRAIPPRTKIFLNNDLVYPQDPVGKGSWMVCHGGTALCIMNGANKPHKRYPPYKYSRGLIPFKYLEIRHKNGSFEKDIDIEGVEAFTLIVVTEKEIKEYRWNQEDLNLHTFSIKKPKIWASAPLYDSKMFEQRKSWFNNFLLKYPDPNPENVFHFYLNGGNDDPHSGLIINRDNGVKTVSLSCLEVKDRKATMHYKEL